MESKTLLEISKTFKPLVVESFRRIQHNGIIYNRRLRISGMTTLLLDEVLGTDMYYSKTEFVLLGYDAVEIVCNTLQIPYKTMNTYIKIDSNMCSYSSGPWDKVAV
jgi:hypothetical protein